MSAKHVTILLALVLVPRQALQGQTFPVDPQRTYLLTKFENPGDSLPIDLQSLGIVPGEWVRLTRLGAFSYWATNVPETSTAMIGVFSSSPELLPASEPHRVPGALAAGPAIVTVPTSWHKLDTDIPEDFAIDDLVLQVPEGAGYLFAAAHDAFYSDNLDSDGDFALQINRTGCIAPLAPDGDCNENGLPDVCDIAAGLEADCNANDRPDACDLADGGSSDDNHNGVPDDCEVLDGDGDGIDDDVDNCPTVANADQGDLDQDELGDACDADVDGDALSNDEEHALGTDPHHPDTDRDGLNDGVEVELAGAGHCPNPLDEDSDGDTLLDGVEENDMGTDACAADSDGDGLPDHIDPFPLDPGGNEPFLAAWSEEVGVDIIELDLDVFDAPRPQAAAGRQRSLFNRAAQAAQQIAAGEYAEASESLNSILVRIDGQDHPKDWMLDGPEKDNLAAQLRLLNDLVMQLGT